MNPTLSERWARSVLSRANRASPWLCWGAAAFFLALALYIDRTAYFFLMAMMQAVIGVIWWERREYRRLLAAKDAEITRLRNALAATAAPPRDG